MGQRASRKESSMQQSLVVLDSSMLLPTPSIFADLLFKSPPLLSSVAGEVREGLFAPHQAKVLLKIVSKAAFAADEVFQLRKEYELMTQLTHPHILRVYGLRENEQQLLIIGELFYAKTLETMVEEQTHFEPVTVMQIMHDVALALKFLHSRDVVHRDVKLENIFFDGKKAKLAGFGYADRLPQGGRFRDCVGSPEYVSPESLLRKSCAKSDFWSLGVCMYRLLTGDAPFSDCKEKEIFIKILEEEPDFDRPALQGKFEPLVRKLLAKNKGNRADENEVFYYCQLFYPQVCRVKKTAKYFEEFWTSLKTICPCTPLKLCLLYLVKKNSVLDAKSLSRFENLFMQINPEFKEWINLKEIGLALNVSRLNVQFEEFMRVCASLENLAFDKKALSSIYFAPRLCQRGVLSKVFETLTAGNESLSLISLKKKLTAFNPKLIENPDFYTLSRPLEMDADSFVRWAHSLLKGEKSDEIKIYTSD